MNFFFVRSTAVLVLALLFLSSADAQDINGPGTGKVFVKVTQDRELSGTPIELTEFKLTTGFGEVTIPMTKVDGIKFNANQQDDAIVAFKNGDVVTGKISLETVSIKTAWGKAHIKASQIDTVLLSQSAGFYPDNTGGKQGWRFTSGISQ